MKKITFLKISLLALLLTGGVESYSQLIVTIDKQTGCANFTNEGDIKKFYLDETQTQSQMCFTVCAGSTVNVAAEHFDNSVIQRIDWSAVGGAVISYTAYTAEITWGVAGGGFINLTVRKRNGSSYQVSVCVDIKPAPQGLINIIGTDEKVISQFCLNTDIYFEFVKYKEENLSYLWDFGDGTFSSEQNPVHSYSNAGDYKVGVTVTNDCNCTLVSTIQIKILKQKATTIDCISTTCEGRMETYTASTMGEWQVEGGTIIDEYGNKYGDKYDSFYTGQSINVLWDNSDFLSAYGYGIIHYRAHSDCSDWIAVKVPVVPLIMKMTVPYMICPGKQTCFSLPQWASTDYQWSIDGVLAPDTDPNHKQLIVLNDQRNEVYIQVADGTHTLSCTYTNTVFGCSGTAEYTFTVEPAVSVYGNKTVCKGSQLKYHINNISDNYRGTIETGYFHNNQKIEVPNSYNNFAVTFAETGVYYLYAQATDGCMSELFEVNVVGVGDMSEMKIKGNPYVCFGMPEQYALSAALPDGIEAIWTITGGSFSPVSQLDTLAGNTVSAIFDGNAEEHELTVFFKTVNYDCPATDTISIEISEKNNVGAKIQFSDGVDFFDMPNPYYICPSTIDNLFVVTPPNGGFEQIRWELTAENFGNISGSNTQSPTVAWNNGLVALYGNQQCHLNVYLTLCGNIQQISRTIIMQPVPIITLADYSPICSGDPVTFKLNSNISLENAQITWQILSNNTILHQTYPDSNLYFLSNPITFTNFSEQTTIATLQVTVDADNICNPVTREFSIPVKPQPKLNVTPSFVNECFPDPNNIFVPLIATVQNSSLGNTQTQWYKSDSPAGTTGTTYNATTTGSYYAITTYTSGTGAGCSTKSNIVNITKSCGTTSVPCYVSPMPPINEITLLPIDCSTIDIISTNHSTNEMWIFNDNRLSINKGDDNDGLATASSDKPGIYTVAHLWNYQNCPVTSSFNLIFPFKPDLRYEINCIGSEYYLILYNVSEYLNLPDVNVFNYNLNITSERFTMNGNIIPESWFESYSTSQSNMFRYNSVTIPLSYFTPNSTLTFGLAIDGAFSYDAGGNDAVVFPVINAPVSCTKNIEIELPAIPETPSFTIQGLSDSQVSICPEDAAHLAINNYDSSLQYEWVFEGLTTEVKATNNLHELDFMPVTTNSTPVNYSIILSINWHGCTIYSDSKQVTINSWSLNARAEQDTTICYGSEALINLEVPFSQLPIGTVQWYRGNELLAGETSHTLTATQSGYYYAKTHTSAGCEAPNTNMVNVFVLPPIEAELTDNNDCGMEEITVTGKIKSPTPTMKYRWKTGVSYTSWQNMPTGGTVSKTVNVTPTNNNVVVTLELQDLSGIDTSYCTTFLSKTVKYIQLSASPVITFTYDLNRYSSQGLYQVYLSVSNAVQLGSGKYSWSNGTTGSSTTVTHGGAYKVIFTNTYGCSSSNEITIPRDPREYMWIFPENGCFASCDDRTNGSLFLLAPSLFAKFSYWEWLRNGTSFFSGTNSNADNLHTSGMGNTAYQLNLTAFPDSQGQTLIAKSKYCDVEYSMCGGCELNATIENFEIVKKELPFYLFNITFRLTNPYHYPLIVELSTFPVTDGFFNPSTVIIPPYSTIYFTTDYYMNAASGSYPTIHLFGSSTYRNEKIVCRDILEGVKPTRTPPRNNSSSESEGTDNQSLNIYPNPAKEEVNILVTASSTGKRTLNIYDLSGKSLFSKPCNEKKNAVNANIASWQQGTYIVVVRENDKITKQGYFVKK